MIFSNNDTHRLTNNNHRLKYKCQIKQCFLIMMLFATICSSMTFKELSVSADSYIIDTTTIYTIIYDRTQQNFGIANDITANPVPSGSAITLTVPSVYTLSYSITLSVIVNGGASIFPNYTISSNIITVNNLFSVSSIVSNVTLVIQNIKNPSPAITTDAFFGYIGSDYAEPNYLQSVVILQPAQFQSCYMSFNPEYVNRTSAMIFTIVAKTQIPSNGGLQIQFPSNLWSEGTVTSTTNYLPITTSMSCGNLSTNVKSTIQCKGTQNQNRVSVSNLFNSVINAGDSFSFQILNFLSPPTGKPADLIKITSEDSSFNKINVCSEYVTDLIPNQMLSSKITITNGGAALTVNQPYTIRFMFETVDAFALTDYFEIEFPTGSIFSFNANALSGGITLIKTNATYSNNILRCYMNPLLSVKNYTSPFTMYISAGTYTAPPSIQPTSNFKISILRNTFPMQVGYQSLTPISTTMSGSLTGRGTDIINKITSYTFSLTINDGLSSNGKIRIKLPVQIQIGSNSTACATLTGTNMIDTPVCNISTVSNIIELTSINQSSSLIPAQTFTVVLNNLVNPFSTAQTSSFQVRSFYKSTDASLVAIGTITGFTSKQATIDASSIVIQSSSYKVLDQSITYTVKVSIENNIDLGGTINIFVPKPIIINTGVLTSSCKRGVNTLTTTTTPCSLISEDSTGYLIKFVSPLSITSVSKGQFIMLQLNSIITNPPSTSPVSTFKVYTYASSGSIISKIQSSLSIQMIDPTTLTSASYERDSSQNYDLTNYQFTIKQLPVLEISAVVFVQFPVQILPNVSSICGMTAPFVNANIACGLSTPTTIKITLPSSIPIGSDIPLTLTISNIRNPTSFRAPGDFTIRTFTSGQTYKYAQGKTSNKKANNIPSEFSHVSGYYTPGYLDSDTTLSLSFQPAYEAPGYIQISIPSYFTIPTGLSCSQVANFNGTCAIISTYTIRVNGQFTSNGLITLQISGFRSTIRAPTSIQYVLLASFTTDNYQLDYSSNKITFSLICTLPCKTCASGNTSSCNSCYDNNQITDKIIYDSNTHSCYSTCPDGKYQNPTTRLCEDCDLNCLTCQRSSTFCTSCKQTSTFKYLSILSVDSQICVSLCQQKMYPDTSKTPPTCVNCVTPCKTCTSLNFCLTCLSTYYFWNNTCSTSCPLGSTVGDNVTGNCQICSSNCATCQTTVDACTSCNSTLILYSKACISQCALPLVYRPDILTCGPCDTQCKTCQKAANNCTSCDPTSEYKYYFTNNCLKSCPDLYYETVSTCTLCSSLNINCDYCINSTYCEKCNTGYVYFNGQCLDVTPNGYVNISGVAQLCQDDCATCSITQTNCTSCKTKNLFGYSCQTNCPATTIPLNKVCKECLPPCKTCSQNTNNCTTCDPNSTPQLYLISNMCQIQCPIFYYPDNSTNKCLPCQTPCKKCTDLVTCVTCDTNYFLYQGLNCISNCPSKFIGINQICEACSSPCVTCVDDTTKCLTCQPTYFYLNSTNRCVLDCGQSLYEEFLNRTCISCTNPCKTCTNTTNTCLSCLTGILYNNQCIFQCPKKMYNDTNICQNCPAQCSACTSKVICTNCTSNYLLYSNFCITKCPDTSAVIIDGVCTKCSSTNCHKCYDNDLCYNCVSDYSLLNGACLSACPAGYETNGTHCNEVLASTLESSNSNMFPVPLTIATAVLLIACMMSKLQNHKTFLAGAVYGLVGITQTLALLYYIYLYYVGYYNDYPIGIYIALGSLGVLYILNVLSIVQSIVLCYDKKHAQWKDSSAMNKFYNAFSTLVGIVISHKFKNVMFSRLFAFTMFSAPLQDVKKFKIFNFFSFISLIHSGGAIFSVITIIKLADNKSQFFHACLDVLIVTGLNVVMAFFNAFKDDQFFNQTTPQGLMLNRIVYGDQDSYNAKISVDGNDIQNEQGHGYYSKIQHTLGSHQPFKFKQSDQSRQDLQSIYDSQSLTNIAQKQYESVSVQAYDMLNQPSSTNNNKIDFSTMRVDDYHNNSKFTTIFQNEDKSIQNTIDYDRNKKVDYSVQKYNDVSLNDRSIQGTNNMNNYKDVSIQRTIDYGNQHDVSVQGTLQNVNHHDVSIQGSAQYNDQSGQYSFMQSQKGVQNQPLLLNDRSVQQSVQNKSWAGQNTIQLKDISIQKEQEQIQYNEFDQTLQQNDETTLKNTENIFYIEQEQDEQGLGSSPPPVNKNNFMLTNDIENNKKTIARQQLQKQKEQDFDFPPQQIKSYEQQLQQKILIKQKQLQKVRKQIQLKQKQSILKQKLMKQQQLKIQKQLKQQLQKQKINNNKLFQQSQKNKLLLIKQQQQHREENAKQLADKSTMMRMIQQVDQAMQTQQLPLQSQSHVPLIESKIQQKPQQNMRIVLQVQNGTSMDQQELFLNGNMFQNAKDKKQNFEVDMSMYIKQKSQYEVDDNSNNDKSIKSIKTKAKPNPRRTNKIQNYQKNRQIQVKSSKHPSLPLHIENQQLFVQSPSKMQKQPGKIRVIDDSFKRVQDQNLIPFQDDIDNVEDQLYDKTQNYIYEVEDRSLEQEEDQIQYDMPANQSNVETNKRYNNNINNIQQIQQQQNKYPPNISLSNINNSQHIYQQQPQQSRALKSQQPKLILDQSNVDKQLKDQTVDQQFFVQQKMEELNDQYFDSSQDIPMGIIDNKQIKKNTQSDVQDYIATKHKHQRILSKQQGLKQLDDKNLLDHQELKRAFNDQRKKLNHSNSQKKNPIPPQNKQTLHVNINKLQSYQIDKPQNQRSNHSISPQKKNSSSSLLANVAKNLVMVNDSKDNQNQKLMKKNSSHKNPLVTQKKWQHQNGKTSNLKSIEQSSQGNDSFLHNAKQISNLKPTNNRRQNPPVAPLQTDKQQTSFSHNAMKIGSNHNLNTQILNQPSTKSFNQPIGGRRKTSVQKMSAKQLLGNDNYGQQVQVHFETKQQEHTPYNSQRNRVEEAIDRPKIPQKAQNANRPATTTSKQRPYIGVRPPIKQNNLRQYDSQQIFGDQYGQQSDEQYSEQNSFDKKISKQHRNNLILDKMMNRPQNDDLYQYYNRASTKKGKSNNKGSKQKRSGSKNINLSKQKLDNDRKLQKIYMQRLDNSVNQHGRNSSKGRY